MINDRVSISGKAAQYMKGEIEIDLFYIINASA